MGQSAKTILVTDDDKMILEGFKDLFERRGYRVLLADNGEIALTWLGRERVDIVFMDIVMPHKEGLETLIEMRRRFPEMPIYSMSGGGKYNKQDFLSLAQKFGATGTLKKPLEPEALLKLALEASSRAA
jgi:DNA-binding NtrC family response regulator